jgi:hypothetical protein
VGGVAGVLVRALPATYGIICYLRPALEATRANLITSAIVAIWHVCLMMHVVLPTWLIGTQRSEVPAFVVVSVALWSVYLPFTRPERILRHRIEQLVKQHSWRGTCSGGITPEQRIVLLRSS